MVILICLLTTLFTTNPRAQSATPEINDLADLSEAIDKIRLRTATPGIAIGLVQSGKPDWQYYSGVSDLKTRRPFDKNSQFRFGSIAKMIVSLSLLKLAEEGKIDLDAKLTNIAPEIEFSNPWEPTHPIRIVHLLNHSTGWDSPHFTENRPLSTTPITIIDALTAHPHSRVSRWQPGSRVAYNNTAFLAAAYIVEKVTELSYETFVEQTFFSPLNMSHSGYYFSDTYRESAVSLYSNNQLQPYQHLNNRAAGGLNSSIDDMLQLLKLLARESPSSVASPALLKAFRTPSGTKATNEGLTFTWGLGNQLFHANGIPLYGHEGSLRGTNAILVYNPVYAFGYVIVGNSNSPAVSQIHARLSDYLTRNIHQPEVKVMRKLSTADKELAGWYKNAAPISDKFSFIQTIIPWKFNVGETTALIKPMIGAAPRLLIPNET
ncbi:beta-lactamase family protein, partial [Pseudomonadales bacterium]|nr:beta-lactamase family protein [Pseudomonadales bacterium]